MEKRLTLEELLKLQGVDPVKDAQKFFEEVDKEKVKLMEEDKYWLNQKTWWKEGK
jgi:hypothetical protein